MSFLNEKPEIPRAKPMPWPTKIIGAKTPSPPDKLQLRVLIILGLIALANFYFWLVQPAHIGFKLFFWLLTVSLIIKTVNWLYEWFFYFWLKAPVSVPQPIRHYSVDVFTSFCPGEPPDMVYRTLLAMTRMTHPHRNYLCDESDDPQILKICQELKVTRLTRVDRFANGKAGNVNNGLKQTQGEICVILDPDHEPAPFFLERVLGYFNDPNIGFVQAVQPYYNQGENLIARGAAEQTYQFYGPLFLGAYGLGTAQVIGANCVFRREALESIGWHKDGATEDRHTAMYLHAQGWRSVYVPEVLTQGLVPSSLGAYYKQQLKWANGCQDLMKRVYPKLFFKFNLGQKIYYFFSIWYYYYGFTTLLDILIPMLVLVTGLYGWAMSLSEFFIMYSPVLLLNLLIRQASQRYLINPKQEAGLHLAGGLLRVGAWWVFITGIFLAVFGQRVPYIPTPKQGTVNNEFKAALPNLILAIAGVMVIIYGLRADLNPYSLLMASLVGLNCLILVYNVLIGQHKFLAWLKPRHILSRQFALGLRHYQLSPVKAEIKSRNKTS